MKITTTIKKESTKEISFLFIEPKVKNRFYISIAIYLIILVANILKGYFLFAIISLLLIPIAILILYLYKKAREEVMDKVFDKLYPNGEYTLTIKLTKDEINFKNSHFNDDINIKYENIKEIKQTNNYILLFLNDNTHFVLTKEDFDYIKFIEKINKKTSKVK